MAEAAAQVRHLGLSLGRILHWHDGLGEFSRQLGLALAQQAPQLAEAERWRFHFHLPRRWHGVFGDAVGYLDTHTTQRVVHFTRTRFALWHILHQHNRMRAPLGTARCIETVHDLNFLHAKTPAKIERYRARLQRRLAARDAVIAITHHVAGDIARELPRLATPLHVIHNGATDLTAAPQQAVPGIGGEPFLLHISRMAPSKNIVALLDLAAAWPEQRLVLAGATSSYTAEVRQQVGARKLRNVTIQLDISEAQKAWLYAHCSGFLFPSLAEGFGLPPIEAMHFGKPVFLSRLTSLPEVGGDAAFYFDSFDGAAMRRVVESGLYAQVHVRRADSVAAHARTFNWQRCALAHVALYRSVLQTHPRG
jgi:glycosyltransferase involved in cell wall biosynthesis